MPKTPKYEGSKLDERRDRKAAKKAGMTLAQWERSAADKKIDKREQRKMDLRAKSKRK